MLQQADNLHAVLVAAAFALRRDRGARHNVPIRWTGGLGSGHSRRISAHSKRLLTSQTGVRLKG